MNTSPDSPSSPSSSSARRWAAARRLALLVAAAATIIAVGYTLENWRGQRAWEECRRKLEAKGEVLDWTAFIPAPVPDAQNFFKAPKMTEWFVKDSLQDLFAPTPANATNAPRPFAPAARKANNLIIAEVKVITPDSPLDPQSSDPVFRFDSASGKEHAAKLLKDAIGPCVIGAKSWLLLARPLEDFKLLHWVLKADAAPTLKELTDFFASADSAPASPANGCLQVEPAGSNVFRISLKAPVYGAAEYLAWTEPLKTDFDLVRAALQRPYARIDCNYQLPFAIGIPNFLSIREAAQVQAQRAQSYLLLGQSEAAWHELAFIHDLNEILLIKPSGKPLTLVGAMIHVAVAGLYTGMVEEGLRRHAWGEPQLLAIEQQLKETTLLAPVVEAFREERAATSRTFETTSRRDLLKLFNLKGPGSKLALSFMPRGWFYQNMALGAEWEQEVLASVDVTNQLVRPGEVSDAVRGLSSKSAQRSPYQFLVAAALPNFAKALQTAAANQTQAEQARLACMLERFRLANGEYPETLGALVPGMTEKLPHDLIGGQPLKYRRTQSGAYVLYSVGWDEKDGGGIPGKSREEGDWVWEIR